MKKYIKPSHIYLDPKESKMIEEGFEETMEERIEPAEMLKNLRLQKGWKPKELGEKIGVNGSEITKMENGEIPISEEHAKKLGKIFQVSYQAFL